MEGAGKFLLGQAQLFLGELQGRDVSNHGNQDRLAVDAHRSGREQTGKAAAVSPPELQFNVALGSGQQEREQPGPCARFVPQVQLRCGMADGVAHADAELLLEGLVDGHQPALFGVSQNDGVRAVVKDRREFLFRAAQGLFGELLFLNVDQQAVQ